MTGADWKERRRTQEIPKCVTDLAVGSVALVVKIVLFAPTAKSDIEMASVHLISQSGIP